MSPPGTTTIRVSTRTRDRLRALAERRGEPAGDLVAALVDAADEEAFLAEVEASFARLSGDPAALAAYRDEGGELEAFASVAPEW